MVMKVSLGGLNTKASQKLRREITQTSNAEVETMEEYAGLVRLVRQSFDKKYRKPANST
ncbi:MAG: hypothetical protein R6X11_06250 [Desulfonatronovibrio sp.]